MARAEIHRIQPTAAVPGGRLVVSGAGFDVRPGVVPDVVLGGARARVVRASSRVVVVEVPDGVPAGNKRWPSKASKARHPTSPLARA